MKRIRKGQYGYLAYQKKYTLLRTVLFFAISLALFFVGYITTKTKTNVLTVVAVLGCLPASKSLVNAIMFLRSSGCSKEAYDEIETVTEELKGGYDFVLTSYDAVFKISHLVVCENQVCGLTEDMKCDTTKGEEHLKEIFRQNGFKNVSFKIFRDSKKYKERLISLNRLKKESGTDTTNEESEMLQLIKSISL